MKIQGNKILVLLFILTIMFSICACGPKVKKEKTAQELYSDGIQYYEAEKYRTAIESFNRLKDWYPFSQYVVEAELKIADSHFYLREYIDAVFAYESFEKLHPTHEKCDYVLFQIGKCYIKQLDTIDRDQSPAYKAVEYFSRLITEHPNSQYINSAKEYIIKCYQNIMSHEFYIGKFYLKNKFYQAALNRFTKIVSDFPDLGLHQKAIEQIQFCKKSLEKP